MKGRLLAAVAFASAGGLILAGIHAVSSLFGSLHAGDTEIAVDSGMLSLPLLGAAFAALGMLLLRQNPTLSASRSTVILFVLFLCCGTAALAFLVTGPALTGALMRGRGYISCEARIGVRTAETRWVSAKEGCGRRNLSP